MPEPTSLPSPFFASLCTRSCLLPAHPKCGPTLRPSFVWEAESQGANALSVERFSACPLALRRSSPSEYIRHFLSYCPCLNYPISSAARFVRTLRPIAVEGPKVRPRGVPTFSCCGCGTFRIFRTRSIKSLVANRGTRFTQFMESADKRGSKLFAWDTRHTQVIRLSPYAFAPTWQEEGKSLSVASSPLCRERHVKTLPVSTPSRLCCAAVSRSWSFCP
jgi:hypothetical protein